VRAALFYNPVAGNRRDARDSDIKQVCAVLAAEGYLAEAIATIRAGSGGEQARKAIAEGVDMIFACGGDGTVHDVLQGIVEGDTPARDRPILGIIPMGSANVLARHLGLSMSPVEAARQQMGFSPRLIPIGRVECNGKQRYFAVMAGAGPDGMLMYTTRTDEKKRVGRVAYYLRAASLFASHRFTSFKLEFTESASGRTRTMPAVATMTVRIDDLGGLFGGLAGDGAVQHPYLQLMAVKPPGWLALPLWFTMSWLGLSRFNPLLHVANVSGFTCTPSSARKVHIQADGEWIGTAPMRVTLVPDAIRLLMP
jgi:diacylglycerol kinase (ATP)